MKFNDYRCTTISMFLLVELKETIRIPPDLFHLPLHEAISEELNRKLANRVRIFIDLLVLVFI